MDCIMGVLQPSTETTVVGYCAYIFTSIYSFILAVFNPIVFLFPSKATRFYDIRNGNTHLADEDDDETDSLFPKTLNFISNLTSKYDSISSKRPDAISQEDRFAPSAVEKAEFATETDETHPVPVSDLSVDLNSALSHSLSPQEKETLSVHQCSTALNSIFIPTKNQNGELEFKLGIKQNNHLFSGSSEENMIPYSNVQQHQNQKNGFISLSPVSSIKSSSSDNSLGHQPSNENTNASLSLSLSDEDEDEDVPESEKIHQCPYCDSKFRMRGYLTRHIKKHSKTKAYHCPFYDKSCQENSKCHQTGGFSRRDTFKTHLKSRHFKYPPGVKSNKRTGVAGWCGICGEKFLNNEIWVERHIELGLCPGLPSEYIKQLKIGKKKTGKHSKFLDVGSSDENLRLLHSSSINRSYLQSPSSSDSSPPQQSNQLQFIQQNRPQTQFVNHHTPIFAGNYKPIFPAQQCNSSSSSIDQPKPQEGHIEHQSAPGLDLETINLLIKQQELTNIINSIKQQQRQDEEMHRLQEVQKMQQFQKIEQFKKIYKFQYEQNMKKAVQSNLYGSANVEKYGNMDNNNNHSISSVPVSAALNEQLSEFLIKSNNGSPFANVIKNSDYQPHSHRGHEFENQHANDENDDYPSLEI